MDIPVEELIDVKDLRFRHLALDRHGPRTRS